MYCQQLPCFASQAARHELCPEAHSLGVSAPQTPRYQSASGIRLPIDPYWGFSLNSKTNISWGQEPHTSSNPYETSFLHMNRENIWGVPPKSRSHQYLAMQTRFVTKIMKWSHSHCGLFGVGSVNLRLYIRADEFVLVWTLNLTFTHGGCLGFVSNKCCVQ